MRIFIDVPFVVSDATLSIIGDAREYTGTEIGGGGGIGGEEGAFNAKADITIFPNDWK